MFNLRYHIASLVAVFLALAVGLLLGSVVVERGLLDRQKDSIVKSLQQDFVTLSQDNKVLRADAARLRRFAQTANPILVGGRLEGKRIAVLANDGRCAALGPVRDALRLAGAEVRVVVIGGPELGIFDHRSETLDALGASAEDTATRVSEISHALAKEWAEAPSARPVTDVMRQAGALDMEQLGPGERLDGVVVACSWEGKPDTAAAGLASRLHDLGLPAVGADAGESYATVSAATGVGLSAVDHVDQPESVLPLIEVLTGEVSGYFGTGPGAETGFPDIRR